MNWVNSKNKSKKSKNRNGFTLIELIVVITIIAVLTVVAMVSFGGVNKKSRDGQRMADLEKVRIALEMARQVGGSYPPRNEQTLMPEGLVPTYLSEMPTDPKEGGYAIWFNSPYSYNLYAKMEDLGSTNGSYDWGWNYMVTNP